MCCAPTETSQLVVGALRLSRRVAGDAGGVSGAPSYEELAAENAELRELNRVLSERLTALETGGPDTP